jgi:hypothetical protein
MSLTGKNSQKPNILIIGQAGRLQYEAVIFAASLQANAPNFAKQLYVAVPQQGPLWANDPTIRGEDTLEILSQLGAQILPFDSAHFGQAYPYGNKIEALKQLPKGEPFIFFDTDTLITGDLSKVPFDYDVPSASRRCTGTWPELELYGPTYTDIWKSLYDKFGLDFESSLDLGEPDEFWKRYLYFNAGYFYYSCPHVFGDKFVEYATAILTDPPRELVCQELNPWLDQVALPLVIHALGGKRDALPKGLLDGDITCHYRLLPLLYAREADHVVEVLESVTSHNKIKKILKQYEPILRMIYQKRGHKVRDLFDRDDLPRKEQAIRNKIKREGFWMR